MTPEEQEEWNWMKIRMTSMEDFIFRFTGSAAVATANAANKAGLRSLSNRVDTLEKDGDAVARQNINGHIANHSAQSGNSIAPHDHVDSKIVVKK